MISLHPKSEAGTRLRKHIEEALGIPAGSRWFEVRFAVDELVTVRCEFYPQVEAEKTESPPTKAIAK